MYNIWRVDNNPFDSKVSYFYILGFYKASDKAQAIREAKSGGFVGPNDSLVIELPSGKLEQVS